MSMASASAVTIPPLAAAVAAQFAAVPGVEAVALGGSVAEAAAGAPGAADADSDLDLYVYAHEEPALAVRAGIARACGRPAQIGHTFWEPGDEWPATADQPAVDMMFRTPAWIDSQLHRLLLRHEASVGASTCLWHNVRTSIPLFDRAGWFCRLQQLAGQPYPEGLRRAIVAKNYPLLRRTTFSLLRQIEVAVDRQDLVSVQHRSRALLASYFDVLFAANGVPHPGEKRLVQQARLRCARLPRTFEAQVETFLRAAGAVPADSSVAGVAHALLDGLDEVLVPLGLVQPPAPGG
jgi:hypothetical protein